MGDDDVIKAFDYHITKPFRFNELKDVVKKACKKRQTANEMQK
jgi:DNA-binding NtrC family response regulator